MNMTHSPISPWYARSPVRNLAVAVSLSLATLAVVLAYEHGSPARPDAPPVVGLVSYVDKLGAVLTVEYGSPQSSDAPSVAKVSPSFPNEIRREPDASVLRAAGISPEPLPPTF